MDTKKIVGVLFFFIAVLLINSIAGTKATIYFLIIVVVGQLIVNSDKITSISDSFK